MNVVTVYPGIIETDMARDGIAAFGRSPALDMQPIGEARALAKHVGRALSRGRRRVIYPRVYWAARWFPSITRWVMDRFTPRLPAPSHA